MPLTHFHPLTQRWFSDRFSAPTEPQRLGWPAIAEGRDTLIAAPTGSGKTLAAFLTSIDRLLRAAIAGNLAERTYVVYVSPLRALSNDIQRNLKTPLAELMGMAEASLLGCPEIRALVRTGDTPAQERQRMLKQPPHILVTTPESLYLLLTARRSREILRHVDTVIVDEIHALARDKRGSHLALSLERLEALVGSRPQRIGLSATQKPLDQIARFLTGVHAGATEPTIIDSGHVRTLDLGVEVPPLDLQAVCTHEHWGQVYDKLVQLIGEHRSTLVFVNTRRLAERITHQLTERLGPEAVASHHGSLAHKSRQRTEQRLKDGSLKAVVATASLELGIDIGHIDLVCQIGTPRSIATFLQRVGRAGHSLNVVPKGRLFALSREDLMECLALVRAVYAGRLDRIQIPEAPLDILAQQIVASVACEDWDEDKLFDVCRQAAPYRDLPREAYESVLQILSEGVASSHGRRGAYIHRDRVNRRLHARKSARLTAITCGGAIPEIADFRVVMDDENRTFVGTLDEDFAIESQAGDIFLLGNTSWRIKHVRGGEVTVSDAHGAPPTIPFWRGEALGRTAELSAEVGQLREDIANRLDNPRSTLDWIQEQGKVGEHGAEQALNYVTAQQAAVGMVPTQKKILFERFFDEAGGMQLVVHAPFGTRINRAWGLAMRKRFCRSFNFELQASADDNGIVLSLGTQHSFPLEQMYRLVPSHLALEVLVQALLAVPFFTTRWRWNVTRALALKRSSGTHKVPPQLQRMRADDLLAAVFPMASACLENVVGDIEVPDHPLVKQTVHDCLHEAMDLNAWLELLKTIEAGSIELVGMDTREPSPFSHELLNANPYAFLDDAPLEERRARAVTLRRTLPAEALQDLGQLDPAAIEQVRLEAWPVVRDADELHDALLSMGALPACEGTEWRAFFEMLVNMGRATTFSGFWVATERWPIVQAIWPDAVPEPAITVPAGVQREWPREEALATLLRGRLECVGPVTVRRLAQDLNLAELDVEIGLAALESQGSVLRGRFSPAQDAPSPPTPLPQGERGEWCDRRLLARIHRLTLEGLRRRIEPVSPEQFLQFLVRHQHAHASSRLRSQAGLRELIEQLQGFEAPAGDWEKFLLPLRMQYNPILLDALTASGQVMWGRLRPTVRLEQRARPLKSLTRSTPISLFLREDLPWLLPAQEEHKNVLGAANATQRLESPVALAPGVYLANGAGRPLSSDAQEVFQALSRHGALFVSQLGALLPLVPSQVEDALGELSAAGLVTSDAFDALRSLMGTQKHASRHFRHQAKRRGAEGGRWSLLRGFVPKVDEPERVEKWARLLLRRYGVMFRDLLDRESAAPPWQELVRCYRRLETRGEIRGGRFVAGVAGEQYALGEVIARLRQVDKPASPDKPATLAATDPLNLAGRVTAGEKVPALPGSRLILQAGQIVTQADIGQGHLQE